MNRIIRTVISLILVISAVIFALLLSPADSSISVVFLFVGGAFGILLSCLLYKKGILINKGIIPNVLAALSGLVITLISADLFYNSWKNSSKLQIIIDSVISDYKTGLRILSYALAVIALPFAIYLFMSIIYSCIIVISSINFQEIISLLKECFTVQKIKKNLFYTLIS